ncbi:hypothetical protein UFOVP1492_89 [uncultured Caudovirales phage]|uniref:Uncharacterized protein n=1 Tax=uncultured Caudovirales phage TaxID=2100421 RepID=A0A6J5R881_9CAUD|nr:hypothetical protein UFOVP1127_45 [uncultured Caudovirales phage]CAB4193139.1 hypothetical protein UFOVP1242_29 [uncultured Caudovirales phage]CAB4217786.1 hypothetical protein UFOVP1492_89 [uncultured Caudovirales phage]CAB5231612.1 hypothetical protein UFOVP1580_118 [uncultured Caudovirales phage]
MLKFIDFKRKGVPQAQGRNGWTNQNGIELMHMEHRNCIALTPINGKNAPGNCQVEVPIEDVTEVAYNLILAAKPELNTGRVLEAKLIYLEGSGHLIANMGYMAGMKGGSAMSRSIILMEGCLAFAKTINCRPEDVIHTNIGEDSRSRANNVLFWVSTDDAPPGTEVSPLTFAEYAAG